MKEDNDLCERLFNFSVQVILFLKKMPSCPENTIFKYQLTKSVSSAGTNYEESQAGSSKADFRNKVLISLREMRESNYWLRLIHATELSVPDGQILNLIRESNELKKILGAILQNSRLKD
jgi:four helix bundle protein